MHRKPDLSLCRQIYPLVGASRAFLLLAALIFGVAAGTAHASRILYTFSGTFSGSLGGTAFTNTVGVFSLTGNTTGVQSEIGGYTNTPPGATFQLTGGNIATFTSSTFGVESEYGAASFIDQVAGFAVGVYNEAIPDSVLSVYGGPYAGMFVSYGSTAEMTSLGNLIITGASGDVTFMASPLAAVPVTAATPEPSSLLLGGTGLLLVASTVRRRLVRS